MLFRVGQKKVIFLSYLFVCFQLEKLQHIVDERGTSIRGLKNELESERSEKQYYMSEVEALNKERYE